MIFKPEIVAGIAKTAHPYGCRKAVLDQIQYVKNSKQFNGAKKALIIGASSGYGLATRISLAFGGSKADTIGVSFETGINKKRTGSAGWYNNIFFKQEAEKEGLVAKNFIGDAFSNEIKEDVIKYIKEEFGQIDLLIYSLASPRRNDPVTGNSYTSKLKTNHDTYTGPTINIETGEIEPKTMSQATDEEIFDTVKVMGGEDWNLWIDALLKADCFQKGAKTIAYSYIGPEVTYPIYKEGTIGAAKRHLEETALKLNEKIKNEIGGEAFVSVNKALVTRASAYIPTFPLYAAILYKVMKEKGIHEDCIMQTQRMFAEKIYGVDKIEFDEEGRLRLDDWELREDVQEEVNKIWAITTPENFKDVSDYEGYKRDFMQLNGFDIDGVDYDEDIDIELLEKLEY